MPFVDVSDFLGRSSVLNSPAVREMLAAIGWAIYHDISADNELLTIRLTATNRDKCWPETTFGFADGNPPRESELDFCCEIYARLITELHFVLYPETVQFVPVEQGLN